MSYFKAILLGNLGQDASSRQIQSGDTAVSFSVAHSRGKGEKATTTWVNCTKWFKPSDNQGVVPFLRKGQQVLVEGEVSARSYVNRDGSPGVSLDMNVLNITLAGGKANADGGQATQAQYQQPQQYAQQQPQQMATHYANGTPVKDEDLPF